MESRPIQESVERMLEKRHRIAVAGFRMENMLWGANAQPTSKEEVLDFIEKEVPQEARRILEEVTESFFRREAYLDEFQKDLEARFRANLSTEGLAIGRELHKQRTDRMPRGEVVLSREPGYMLLAYSDDRDFVEAEGQGYEVIDGEVVSRILGQYSSRYTFRWENEGHPKYGEQTSHFDWEKETAGTTLPREVVKEAPTITVAGFSKENVAFEALRTYTHERQHNIYHVLNRGYRRQDDLYYNLKYDGLKDEVLARIRDRSWDIVEFASHDTYESLWKNQSEEDRAIALKTLAEIQENAGNLLGLFETLELRAILTYHLIDVPFLKIPERLTLLEKYYFKLYNDIPVELIPILREDHPDAPFLSDAKYYQSEMEGEQRVLAAEAATTFDAWENAYNKFVEYLLTTNGEAVGERKGDLLSAQQAAMRALQKYKDSLP